MFKVWTDPNGAVAKFRLADESAPRWGVNQLRWGQLLLHTGHKKEAKARLDKARSLSLSVSDRAQLEDLLRQVSPGSRM